MSTDQETTTSQWIVPGLCFVLGLVMLGTQLAHDDLTMGLVLLAIMWVYGLGIVLWRRHSELGDLVSGGPSDERRQSIQVAALAVTGQVLLLTIVIAFIVQLARGVDTDPWSALGALGGATYLVSLAVIRARS